MPPQVWIRPWQVISAVTYCVLLLTAHIPRSQRVGVWWFYPISLAVLLLVVAVRVFVNVCVCVCGSMCLWMCWWLRHTCVFRWLAGSTQHPNTNHTGVHHRTHPPHTAPADQSHTPLCSAPPPHPCILPHPRTPVDSIPRHVAFPWPHTCHPDTHPAWVGVGHGGVWDANGIDGMDPVGDSAGWYAAAAGIVSVCIRCCSGGKRHCAGGEQISLCCRGAAEGGGATTTEGWECAGCYTTQNTATRGGISK